MAKKNDNCASRRTSENTGIVVPLINLSDYQFSQIFSYEPKNNLQLNVTFLAFLPLFALRIASPFESKT